MCIRDRSSRFHDIFRSNSGKQGLLTGELKQEDIEAIWQWLDERPGSEITVDLEENKVYFGDFEAPFSVADEHTRHRLLNGLDDIDLTLTHSDAIAEYESKRPSFKPSALPAKSFGDAKIDTEVYNTASPFAQGDTQ